MLATFDTAYNRFLLLAAALLLAIAVSMTFYQVVTRFVLTDPSPWSELAARALIIWSVFLAMAVVIRRGDLIAIDMVFNFFPAIKRFWLRCWVLLWIFAFLLILLYFGIEITIRVYHQSVSLLDVSMSWLYLAIPVGAGLSLISLFFRLLELYAEHRKVRATL